MGSSRESEKIGDRGLLGKTLKRHRQADFPRVTQVELSKNLMAGKNIEGQDLTERPRSDLKIDKRFVGELERGDTEDLRFIDLLFIADLYHISVINLVYSVSEEVPFAFNVLQDDQSYTPTPFDIPTAPGARYWVPKYRLANSNHILLKLQLQPGGTSPTDHPKHEEDEVLEVLKGEVEVEFAGHKVHLSVGDRVHFKNVDHLIINSSEDEEAIVLLQRELDELRAIREYR